MEPIHRAAFDGDLATVTQLLNEDAGRLDARGEEQTFKLHSGTTLITSSCYTPLMMAVIRKNEAGNGVVVLLLERGADVRLTDSQGWSAAHWACKAEKSACLELLIEAGYPFDNDGSASEPLFIWQRPLRVLGLRGACSCSCTMVSTWTSQTAWGGPSCTMPRPQ